MVETNKAFSASTQNQDNKSEPEFKLLSQKQFEECIRTHFDSITKVLSDSVQLVHQLIAHPLRNTQPAVSEPSTSHVGSSLDIESSCKVGKTVSQNKFTIVVFNHFMGSKREKGILANSFCFEVSRKQ